MESGDRFCLKLKSILVPFSLTLDDSPQAHGPPPLSRTTFEEMLAVRMQDYFGERHLHGITPMSSGHSRLTTRGRVLIDTVGRETPLGSEPLGLSPPPTFEEMDLNGDGVISRAEFDQASWNHRHRPASSASSSSRSMRRSALASEDASHRHSPPPLPVRSLKHPVGKGGWAEAIASELSNPPDGEASGSSQQGNCIKNEVFEKRTLPESEETLRVWKRRWARAVLSRGDPRHLGSSSHGVEEAVSSDGTGVDHTPGSSSSDGAVPVVRERVLPRSLSQRQPTPSDKV